MVKKATKVESEGQLEVTEVLDAEGTQQVSTAIAKFDPVKAALTALVKNIETTVYDAKTPDGEETARAFRRQCVEVRTTGDKVYKIINAPMLEAQRKARAENQEIKTAIEPHEAKLNAVIKEIDDAREAEKQRKIAIEEARV